MAYFRQKLRQLTGQLTESARLDLLPDFPDAHIAVETDQPDFMRTLQDEREQEWRGGAFNKEEKKTKQPKYSNGMDKQQANDRKKLGSIIHGKLKRINESLLQALQNQKATPAESRMRLRYGAELKFDEKKQKHYVVFKKAYQLYEDVVGQQFAETPELFHPDFSISNSKLANEAIASWSLPHRRFCPGSGEVCAGCYVDSGPISFKEPAVRRWMNFFATKNPNFVDEAVGMIHRIRNNPRVERVMDFDRPIAGTKGQFEQLLNPDGTPTAYDWDHIRWHDAGDFYDAEYIDKIAQIVQRTPEMRNYWYTKSHSRPDLKAAMMRLAALPNTKHIQSVGGRDDAHIDPTQPMAVVFPDRGDGEGDQWVDAYQSDRVAANPANFRIALAAHGKLSGKLDLAQHVRNAPQIHELLPQALSKWKGREVKKSLPAPPPTVSTRRKPAVRSRRSVRRMAQYFRKLLPAVKSESDSLEPLEKVLGENYTTKHSFHGVGQDPQKDSFQVNVLDSKGGIAGHAYVVNRADGLSLYRVGCHPDHEYNQSKIIAHLKNHAETVTKKKVRMMEKSEQLVKGGVIDFASAKARIQQTGKSKRNPFVKKVDKSKLPTKEKIETALAEQAQAGSPYAEPRFDVSSGSHPSTTSTTQSQPPPAESRLPVHDRSRAERIRGSMAKVSQLMAELKAMSYRTPEDQPPKPAPTPSRGGLKLASQDPTKKEEARLSQPKNALQKIQDRHPGEIPRDHPDREKMASFINQLNQTPGKRGAALQLYERFLGGKGYTKGEKSLLSLLIKSEVMGDL